jgi:hypothetical protein
LRSIWEEVEELVYLIEGASEKESVVGLKSHLWSYGVDELTIAVEFSEKEVVEISKSC